MNKIVVLVTGVFLLSVKVNAQTTDTVPGNAISITGTGNYVSVPFDTLLNPSDNFTIEFWARADGSGPNGYRAALSSQVTDSQSKGYYFYADNEDKWESWIGYGSNWSVIEGTDVVIGEWTHLVMTYSEGTQKFYINGELQGSVTSLSFIPNSSANFRIGNITDAETGYGWNGLIDEVRVWDDVRTEQEIRESMYETVPGDEANLVAYFQLNEGTGTTTDDEVGGFTGMFVNTPVWTTSEIPVGPVTSTSTTAFTSGTVNLGTVSISTTDNFDNAIDITVSEIGNEPNVAPSGVDSYVDDRYWVIQSFGIPGSYKVNLTFTVPSSITSYGANPESEYRLFRRPEIGVGTWSLVRDHADLVQSTSIRFDSLSTLGQFAIGIVPRTHVSSVTPTQNSLSVSLSSDIQVTFSDAIDISTLIDTTSFIVKGHINGRYEGSFSFSADSTVVTFNPDSSFFYGELITVKVTNNIMDSNDEAIKPYSFQFNAEVATTFGTFGSETEYSTGNNPRYISISDLDQDRKADIITSGLSSFTLFLNTGTDSLGTGLSLSNGTFSLGFVTSDFNGDGFEDIAYADNSTQTYVIMNNGDGTFGSATGYGSGGIQTYFVTAGDFNGDGFDDLVSTVASSNYVSIRFNNGDGTFGSATTVTTGLAPLEAFIYDLDNDGDLDIVTNNTAGRNLSILLNNGDGSFTASDIYSIFSSSNSLFVSDMDGDGDGDIVVTINGFVSIGVIKNNGDATFSSITYYSVVHTPISVKVGDVDGDGDGDVLVSSQYLSGFSVLKNNGDGTLSTRVDYIQGNTTIGLNIADVNHDGALDVITSKSSDNKLSVIYGTPPDYTAPSIQSLSPGNGDTLNSNYSTLTLVFDEPVIAQASKYITLYDEDDNQVQQFVATSVSLSGASVTITPSNLFSDGEYYLLIDSGSFKDLSGNSFSGVTNDSTWRFLIDISGPELQSTYPSDNDTLSYGLSRLQITFSEPINAQANKYISVYNSGDVLIDQFSVTGSSVSISDDQLSISFSEYISDGGYYIQIDAGAFKDAIGNSSPAVDEKTTWNFFIDVIETDSVSGNVISISGSNNYISVPYDSILNPSDNFTIEFWAKAEGGAGGFRAPIASEDTKNGNTQMGYYFYASSSDTWQGWIGKGEGLGWSITNGPAVTLGEWTHLAMSYSGGTQKLYVNGILVDSLTAVPFVANDNKPFTIGALGENTSVFNWNGKIDEIRLWGVTRSQKEIRENMFLTTQGIHSEHLISYFQLNEGSGTTTSDPAGGLTGTFVNSPVWAVSNIPVGEGSSATVTEFTSGTADIGTVSLTTTDDYDNAISLTGTKITVAPNELPTGYTELLSDQYWVINEFGTPGTYSLNATFTVPSAFTSSGTNAASEYRLFQRDSVNAVGSWSEIKSSASSVGATTLQFNGLSSLGQFAIARVKQSVSITGSEGWRLMASPVNNSTYSALLGSLWTQGFTGASLNSGTSNVYMWSDTSTTSSNTNWVSISNLSDTVESGSGMLVYVFSDDNGPTAGNSGFPKTIQVTGTENSGTQTLTGLLNQNTDGWTLLGNPFLNDIDWDLISKTNMYSSVYVWDHNSSGWKSWNGTTGSLTNGVIPAFNGFFVQTFTSSPTLEIAESAKVDGDVGFYGKVTKKESPLVFSIKTEMEETSNSTWFSFNHNAETGLDAFDAVKLVPLREDYLQLSSSSTTGELLDVNNYPLEQGLVEIPVHFESTISGRVTLSILENKLPDDWDIRLRDNKTGNELELNEPYEFDYKSTFAKKSTSGNVALKVNANVTEEARFTLIINRASVVPNEERDDLPSVVELHQNYPNPFNPSTTINFAVPEQSNVQLVVFDMLGRKVAELLNEPKSPGRYSIHFDASQLASGLYLYRLQVGSSVLTKKMTLIK